MATQNRVTLADVARVAKVSASTASLAFSGHGPISAATRDKVLAAAATLGYLGPDPTARSLRRGKSGVVGIVIGDEISRTFRDPVTIATLDSMVTALAELDLSPLLIPVYQQTGPDALHPAERTNLDAAILMACMTPTDEDVTVLRRRKVPMIGIEGPSAPDIHSIAVDDRRATADLARRLTAVGHDKIAVITLPFNEHRRFGEVTGVRMQELVFGPASHRIAGVIDAGVTPVRIIEVQASLVEYGIDAGRLLLDVAPAKRPTAIIAQSDLLAAGAVLAARELNLRIPDQVAIVGFDGIDLPWLTPEILTTAAQPLDEKGAAAAHAVGKLLDGETLEDVTLPVEYRQGTTSKALD